jgi:hypothetical protein
MHPLESLTRGIHHEMTVVPLYHGQRRSGYSRHIQGGHPVHQRLRDEAMPQGVKAYTRRQSRLLGGGPNQLMPIRMRPGLAVIASEEKVAWELTLRKTIEKSHSGVWQRYRADRILCQKMRERGQPNIVRCSFGCAPSMRRTNALSPFASGRATPRGPGSPKWRRWAGISCRRIARVESAARACRGRPPWRSPAR